MAAGCGDFERALRPGLPADIGEVGGRRIASDRSRRNETSQRLVAGHMRADGEQAFRRMHDGIFHQRGFRGAGLGQHECAPVAMRLERHRQRAADRTQIAGQCELAGELVSGQRCRGQLSGRGENA